MPAGGLTNSLLHLFIIYFAIIKMFQWIFVFLWLTVIAKKLLFSQVYDALDWLNKTWCGVIFNHRHKSMEVTSLCHCSILFDLPGGLYRPPHGSAAFMQSSAIIGYTSHMLWQQLISWHLHCDGDSELSTGTAVRKGQGRIYGVQWWLCDPHLEKQMPLKSDKSMWQARGCSYLQWNRNHPAPSPKHQIFNVSNYLQEKISDILVQWRGNRDKSDLVKVWCHRSQLNPNYPLAV